MAGDEEASGAPAAGYMSARGSIAQGGCFGAGAGSGVMAQRKSMVHECARCALYEHHGIQASKTWLHREKDCPRIDALTVLRVGIHEV